MKVNQIPKNSANLILRIFWEGWLVGGTMQRKLPTPLQGISSSPSATIIISDLVIIIMLLLLLLLIIIIIIIIIIMRSKLPRPNTPAWNFRQINHFTQPGVLSSSEGFRVRKTSMSAMQVRNGFAGCPAWWNQESVRTLKNYWNDLQSNRMIWKVSGLSAIIGGLKTILPTVCICLRLFRL